MAESQDTFSYSASIHAELDKSISQSRLEPYLGHVGGTDKDMAIKMYLWNARIAKAFLFPLHVVEVTVRNAIHEAFSTAFGDDWMHPTSGQLFFRLAPESQFSINKALSRLQRTNPGWDPEPRDLVAALTFVIDLNDATVADLLATVPTPLIGAVDVGVSTGDVAARFFPLNTPQASRPQGLLVMDGATIIGIILRPEFRY